MRTRSCGPGTRGQSTTIGIVLVFGIMLAGASVVVFFGASAIGDSQQSLSTQRAEKALTQLDSRAALVALGNTDTQTVSFARRGVEQFRVENGTGWMNVTIENTTDGSTDFLVNQTMGSVVYENGDDLLAYQGGGVWKSSGDGTVMVSPPEFHFRNGTLTLPVVNVTGDRALGTGASVTHTETTRKFPDRSGTDRDNPLDQHRVELTVQSDHYQAWGKYFEDRTDGEVEYDHPKNEVRLELISPIGLTKVDAATASYAPSSNFTVSGTADNPCSGGEVVYLNSYNSSGTDDDYCDQHEASPPETGSKGNVTYGKNITLTSGAGGALINGSLRAGGFVEIQAGSGNGVCDNSGGKPDICGDIFYTDDCLPSPSDCGDVQEPPGTTVEQIAGFGAKTPINGIVDATESDLQSSNDNGATPNVSSNAVSFGADGPTDHATLPAGSYYLHELDMGGDENLTLDTSGGNIKIAIRDYVDMENEDTIHVGGDGIVRVYVKGENPNNVGGEDVMLHMDRATLDIPGDDAKQLRIYGKDNFNASLVGGGGPNRVELTGVLFAPPGVAGTGWVKLDHASIFGGVVTGDTTLETHGSIHYDEALKNSEVISRDAKVVKVTYLHVTVNRIHVEND